MHKHACVFQAYLRIHEVGLQRLRERIGKQLFALPSKSIAMKCSELLRQLEKADLREVSQKGSHIKLKHDDFSETILFPNHGSLELGIRRTH